ncbi:MAG: hypothetical protein WDW36_002812 [Sanguina aurantia]
MDHQRSASIAALKRLQREVFSELVTIKQRLEDLTPKKEVKDLVIPVEGSAVHAHARQLSSELRLRTDAQLSGVLSVGAMALLSQVVIKHEVTPSLRLLLAPLGGSLENISRRVSPFAGPGLTATSRRSHSAEGLLSRGTGAGATLAHGPASVSFGHFMTGAPPTLRSLGSAVQHLHHSVAQISLHLEGGACASLILSTSGMHPALAAAAPARPASSRPPATNSASTSGGGGSSAPQSPAPTPPQAVSRPLSSPSAASAAPSSAAPVLDPVPATAAAAAATGRSNSSGLWDAARPLCFRGLLLPDSGSSRSSDDASSESRRGKVAGSSLSVASAVKPPRVQAGLVATLPVSGHCVLSGWTSHRQDVPPAWGLQLTAYDQVQECSGRALVASIRRGHATAISSDRPPVAAPVVMEVSARIPLADGLSLTPGVLLQLLPRHSSVMPGVQMQWAY